MTVRSVAGAIVVDLAAWLAVHVAAGYLVHRLPDRLLEDDRWLFRARAFEDGGRFYVRALRIKRWKRFLPEGGDVFPGGFNKARLVVAEDAHLRDHLRETRRAELGHWLTMAPAPVFFAWNRWYVTLGMQVYAVAVNGPCIASQRYNRIRLHRVLARRDRARAQAGGQRKMAER